MLTLTKKTDYALIAASHMARAGDRVSSAREIADSYHLSQSLLMNVLKQLTRQGLVSSTRGSKGGYVLAEEAENISLNRLIGAVEGPLQLVRCKPRRAGNGSACDLVKTCPLRSPVQRVQDRLEEFLSNITLAEIAREWPEVAPLNALTAGMQV